jgi:hypothetical protein
LKRQTEEKRLNTENTENGGNHREESDRKTTAGREFPRE